MNVKAVEAAAEPIAVFRDWLKEARKQEINDPNAAALATASRDGAPSVRMVLVKGVDDRGFSFFTNAQSRKGIELAENPRAAMCFHWKTLRRQVRVEGSVTELPPSETDAYFHSRSRQSQLGAAVSKQSRVLGSPETLVAMVRDLEVRTPGEIQRPEWWKGYVLKPERVEFWIDGKDRLHDRILFERSGTVWIKHRLYP
ncbi:pyridoxamine 5'-phosphate oxidase [Edaphobacter bradus]|uniref:pyridoxamine 5'-phosphate oxidase n=1 Tax=Edaphobacter bradus TaxID=2259016 RepID=UPI0021E0F81C|nr:pyridoxamine 5'-phosphate oxidase [Edaphobacter bradus]